MTVTAPPTRRPRSLVVNTVATAGANILRGAIAFGATIVLTRELATGPRGAFSFVTTAALLLVMVAGLGISTALTRAKAKDAKTVEELYSAATFLGISFGTAAAGIFLIAYAVVPGSLFEGVTLEQALIVAVLVPPLLVLNHWNAVAYLEDRIPEFSIAMIVGAVAFLVGIAAVSATNELTANQAAVVWAISAVVPLVIVFRPARIARLWAVRPLVLSLLKFGLRTNLAIIALILAWRIDIFLVKGYRGLSELGLYAAAVGLAEIVMQVAVSARVALTPRQGAAEDRDRLVTSICQVTRLTLAAGGLVALGMALFATPIVRGLYGGRYAAAGTALAWLMPGVVALVAQGPFVDYLLVENKILGVTVATVSSVVVNVSLNAVLLRDHTFVAAAVVATATYALSCVWCMWLFRQATGTTWRDMTILRRADVSAVAQRRRRRTTDSTR